MVCLAVASVAGVRVGRIPCVRSPCLPMTRTMPVLGHGSVLNIARRVKAPVTIALPTAIRVQVVALATRLP
eukprot:11192549-Lingulodinium_polyedra.AAC.1